MDWDTQIRGSLIEYGGGHGKPLRRQWLERMWKFPPDHLLSRNWHSIICLQWKYIFPTYKILSSQWVHFPYFTLSSTCGHNFCMSVCTHLAIPSLNSCIELLCLLYIHASNHCLFVGRRAKVNRCPHLTNSYPRFFRYSYVATHGYYASIREIVLYFFNE